MKRIYFFITLLAIGGAIFAGWLMKSNPGRPVLGEYVVPGETEKSGAAAYKAWLFELRKNPATGRLDEEDLLLAMQQVREARANQQRGARSLGLEWEHLGPTNIGGRTRAIAIDPNNPSRMYGGSVSGGLFVSDDAGASWAPHPQNPLLESTLISSIAIAANGDVYFGTGEAYIGFYDGIGSFTHGFTGNGIYKSTDGGATFSVLDATVPTPGTPGAQSSDTWAYVNRIHCHPTDANTIIAATNRGMRVSLDGGQTWTTPTDDGGTPLIGASDDVKFASDGRAYIISSKRFLRSVSTSDYSTFEAPTSDLPSTGSIRRAVLAVAPSDPNTLYIYASANITEALLGIYRSTNGGTNWTTIASGGSTFFNPPGSQGNWNLALVVNPADPDRIYIGGQLEAYSWRASAGAWDQIAAPFGGSLFPKYVHPDHHWFVFHPTNPNILYFGTDGGITRTLNARDQFPDWKEVNKNYSTFQSHGVGAGLEGQVIGGSQDQGTAYLDYSGNSLGEAREVLGGDGGQGEISKLRPNYQFAWFFDFSNGGGALRRSPNDGSSYSSMFDQNIDVNQNGVPSNGAAFVEQDLLWEDYELFFTFRDVLEEGGSVEYPAGSGNMVMEGDVVTFRGESIELNERNLVRAKFFCGTNNGLWVTNEPLKSSGEGQPEWFRLSEGYSVGDVTAIDATADGDIVYVGTSSGNIWRISNLNSGIYEYQEYDSNPDNALQWFPDSSNILVQNIGNIGGYVTGIAVDPNNDDLVVASRGGYLVATNVWRTTNATSGSPAWASISGSLPNIPVFDVMIDYYNSSQIYAATEFGVWSYDGSTWAQETSILGNVPVFEIRQDMMRDPECRPIYIGTHGRGFFRSTNLVPTSLGCDFRLGSGSLGVEAPAGLQATMHLFPNPASGFARVNFGLDEAVNNLRVDVYDLTGKLVKTVLNGSRYAMGNYQQDFSVADLPNGNYLVVLEANTGRKSAKLVVMH